MQSIDMAIPLREVQSLAESNTFIGFGNCGYVTRENSATIRPNMKTNIRSNIVLYIPNIKHNASNVWLKSSKIM